MKKENTNEILKFICKSFTITASVAALFWLLTNEQAKAVINENLHIHRDIATKIRTLR